MDRLYFYSGSADKKPGKGANENVSDPSSYRILSAIPHWRRILSNFYIDEFSYKDKRYRSAEHAIQGVKISIADEVRGSYFSLDSGHEIGRSGPEVARSNRKLVVLDHHQLSHLSKSNYLEEILYAKFSQIDDAKRVLLATGDAELWHGAPRVGKQRQFALERVRSRLSE